MNVSGSGNTIDAIERWAIRYARVAIGVAFLSAVAGRFGLWSGMLQWERFGRFIDRTATLNGWAPAALVPFLAWSATILETTFGIALILGLATRWVALGSAGLLAWFAVAMVVYDGAKAPLDYSVFSASAGALLLALAVDRTRRPS
jgi:putative oxidoreductase